MADDIALIIRIVRDHAGQLRDTVGMACWEVCDEIERLRAAGDEIVAAAKPLDGFMANTEAIVTRFENALVTWQEARRG